MRLPSILSPDGRQAWAFAAICGGCFVFTLFAAVGVWLVSGNPRYSLILALCAHLQLLVGMSAFGFVLGRRMSFEAGKDGAKLNDTAAAAQDVADAAQQEATHIKDAPG